MFDVVTGAAGFLDSTLVRALVHQAVEVPGAEVVVADVRDAEALARAAGEARPPRWDTPRWLAWSSAPMVGWRPTLR